MNPGKKNLFIFSVLMILILIVVFLPKNDKDIIHSSLVQISQTSDDFATALGPRVFDFPADFGPHNEYQTEWWYYTGNLEDDDGRHFGYQLTFFRRALSPVDEISERNSEWAADQVYLAHFALSDVQTNEFQFAEKIQRGAAGLAGSKVENANFSVWLDNWQVKQLEEDVFQLSVEEEDIFLWLDLKNIKDITLQGDRGFSQKGDQAGNASYYISQTRLQTSGSVKIGGESFYVSGLSWMDHEFSTSALGEGLVGWDWFSLQLSDGSDLMLFTIRDSEGKISEFSSGNYILENGENKFFGQTAFTIEAVNYWKSKNSGAEYPSGWRIFIPELDLNLEIEPYQEDQELLVSFTYWEGAVKISGEIAGREVTGNGYVELTGYAQSMQGQF